MKLSDINETLDYKDRRHDDDLRQERPWRKDATPLNKPPVNPDYPTKPFDYDEWMKVSNRVLEDSESPEVGDTIRTKKMQMQGKVEKLGTNAAGYPEVFFRIEDGRLMKTPVDNVIVIQKLADEDISEGSSDNFTADDIHALETITDLATCKQKAKELIQTNSKRKMKPEKVTFFLNKIDQMPSTMKVIKLMYDLMLSGESQGVIGSRNSMSSNSYRKRFGEGGMGGINQCAPANDVSYEDVLDEVKSMWEEQLNELSVDKLNAYVSSAKSPDNFRQGRSLGKIARSASFGVPTAQDKINAKTGNRSGSVAKHGAIRQGPTPRDIDESDDPCWKNYKQIGMKNKNGKQVPNCVPVEEKNMPGEVPVDSADKESDMPQKQSAKIPVKTPDKIDPWNGNAKKLAKAPKGTMQGKDDIRFSELVRDTIEAHGINDAFEYYVKKHGLSPRQFAIFAGLNATPVSKPRVKGDWTDPSRSNRPKNKGWWAKMRGKLPFEE